MHNVDKSTWTIQTLVCDCEHLYSEAERHRSVAAAAAALQSLHLTSNQAEGNSHVSDVQHRRQVIRSDYRKGVGWLRC